MTTNDLSSVEFSSEGEKLLTTYGTTTLPDTQETGNVQRKASWWGRCIEVVTCIDVVQKGTAIASAVGTGILAYMGINYFLTTGYSSAASLACGAGVGALVPVAIHMGLRAPVANKVLDFMSKWSFVAWQVATGWALNAGCPVSGCGLWNAITPPLSVVYGANMVFGAMAGCYLVLHLRSIILKEAEHEPKELPPAQKNRLLLECSTQEPVRFAIEQAAKLAPATALVVLEQFALISAPEWKLAYFFLFGSTIGSTASFVFYKVKDQIEQRYPTRRNAYNEVVIPTPTRVIRILEKGFFFTTSPLLGILFTTKHPLSALWFGAIMSGTKMVQLRRFENLQQPDRTISRIKWKTCHTVAQGICLGLGVGWFAWGLTDPSNTLWDRVYLASMIVSAFANYPLTRALLAKWDPQQRSLFLNTLRFYIIDNPSLHIPYFMRRFGGPLGDTAQPSSAQNVIEDLLAWISFGSTWASYTAYNGAKKRTDKSPPIELSPIIIISSTAVLASRGTLGAVK